MIVTQRLPAPSGNVWYLAYGSNLSASKFIHDRQIHPVATAVVTVPGWTLIMDSAGVPYSEPAFASISAIHGVMDEKSVQLIGTAYELTPEMYRKVLASEGGGIAYAEVEVRAQRLVHGSAEAETQTFATRSLVTVLEREARPSKRYMVRHISLSCSSPTDRSRISRISYVPGRERWTCLPPTKSSWMGYLYTSRRASHSLG